MPDHLHWWFAKCGPRPSALPGSLLEIKIIGVPIVAQQKRIRLGTMRLRVLVPGLAQWVKDRSIVAVSCGIGYRCGLNLALLWLWCRLAAVAPFRRLAWEPPYAADAALKKRKKEKFLGLSSDINWKLRLNWKLWRWNPGTQESVF